MAYTDDIIALSPDHYHTFDNTLLDSGSIGGHIWTNTNTDFDTVQISRDSTYSLRTNSTSDSMIGTNLPTTGGAPIKQVAFWFRCTNIQGPPTLIYKEGGITAGIAFIMWAGNNVMLQVWDGNGSVIKQIYCKTPLSLNRNYHLSARYEDGTMGDDVKFYIDGTEQLTTNVDSNIGQPMTNYTGQPYIGRLDIDNIIVGNGDCLLVPPITGYMSNWVSWTTPPSFNDFYNKVYGAGSIPEFIISSDTPNNMQGTLDALIGTTCGDYPLSILIEEVDGGGDLELSGTRIFFSEQASTHIRYEGSGTLSWWNWEGSNASITSGNVNIVNPSYLYINGIVPGSNIYIYDDEILGDGFFGTELIQSTVATTNYAFSHGGQNNKIKIQIIKDGYEEILTYYDLIGNDQTLTVFPIKEEN